MQIPSRNEFPAQNLREDLDAACCSRYAEGGGGMTKEYSYDLEICGCGAK